MRAEMEELNKIVATLASNPSFLATFIIAMLWSMAWKGVALYRAASRRDLRWFIALFVLNTLGILEAFYILVVSDRERGGEEKKA